MKKILFLSMHPAPYRDPILNYLKEIYRNKIVILTLYPNQTTHKEWGEIEKLYNDIKIDKFYKIFGRIDIHKKFIRTLLSIKYDIIFIPGYMPLASLISYIYSKIRNKKIIYCIDTTEKKYGSEPLTIVNYLCAKFADKIYIPGTAARKLWESRGIRADKIFEGLYTLDWDEISKKLVNYYSDSIKNILFKVENKYKYLFIGKLIPERNIVNLLEAYRKISDESNVLIIVGSGEQSKNVLDFLNNHPQINVIFIPRLPYNEIHSLYNSADVYIHPGREPYSVSIQEAALAGLKIISTNQVGATQDFVSEGNNGIVIENNNITKLAEAMNNIKKLKVSKYYIEYLRNEKSIKYSKLQIDSLFRSIKVG